MADDTRSDNVEVVEADVEQARARLANTIAKLTSPETVDATKKEVTGIAQGYKDDVLRQVVGYKDGIVYDVRQRVLNNPLPVALIGAGIAYRLYKHPPITTLLVGTGIALLMRGGSAGTGSSAYRNPYDRSQPRGYVPGGVAGYGYPVEASAPGTSPGERIGAVATDVGQRAAETGTRLRDAAYEARSHIAETVEWAGSRVQEVAGEARSRVSQTAAAASGFIDHATTRIGEVAESATERAGTTLETLQRSPLALGAIGLTAGLALGRRIRATETGDYYAEATTHALGRGARGVGHGARVAASRVGSVAGDAVEAAGRAASAASSAAADLAGTVTSRVPEVASDVADAASRAARTAGEQVRHVVPSFGSDEETAPSPRPHSAPARRGPEARQREREPRRIETGEWLERQTREVAERYPLLLGAIGLALGALVGGSLGRTETENRTFGSASDRLKARARDLATERYDGLVGAVEHLAEELQTGGSSQGGASAAARGGPGPGRGGGGEPAAGRGGSAPRPRPGSAAAGNTGPVV